MVPSLLGVHFGSPLHEACDAPLRRDQIVVAPSLFGSARNGTTFHDLRDEVQEAIRAEEDDVTWSYESTGCRTSRRPSWRCGAACASTSPSTGQRVARALRSTGGGRSASTAARPSTFDDARVLVCAFVRRVNSLLHRRPDEDPFTAPA
jgi:hypothetical protein